MRTAPASHKTERGRGWLRPLALFFYFCTAAAFKNALNFSGSLCLNRSLVIQPFIACVTIKELGLPRVRTAHKRSIYSSQGASDADYARALFLSNTAEERALPFGRLWYGEPNAVSNAIGYAKRYSRSHQAVIRVYNAAPTDPKNGRDSILRSARKDRSCPDL